MGVRSGQIELKLFKDTQSKENDHFRGKTYHLGLKLISILASCNNILPIMQTATACRSEMLKPSRKCGW